METGGPHSTADPSRWFGASGLSAARQGKLLHSMSPSSEESRAHPRVAAEVDVELHHQGLVLLGRTHNLSRGGLACELDLTTQPVGPANLPTLGQELQVSLALVFDEQTYSEPLSLRARVVWCTAFQDRAQVGLSFMGLTGESRNYLDLFFRYLSEGQDASTKKDARKDHGGFFD